MRCFRLFVFLVVGLGLITASSIVAFGETAEENAVRFKWAFIYQDNPGAQEEVLDFKKSPAVHSKGQLRIYIEPVGNTHLYLFYLDSSKDLYLLFPEDPGYYRVAADHGNTSIFLPDRDGWFEMDDTTGVEKFYLLAAENRLASLEDLVTDYLAEPGDGERKARVLDEIKRIRKEHSGLASIAEKGVPIAGTIRTRDLSSTISGLAQLVESTGFYAKTIRLKHE